MSKQKFEVASVQEKPCSHPPKLLRKTDNGEICCSLCGMVISDFELDPGFTPARPLHIRIEDMSYVEKSVVRVTSEALRIAEKLHLPHSKQEVENLVQKVIVNAKKLGYRFTKEQVVAFTVYEVAKLHGKPLNIKTYCRLLEELGIHITPKKFFKVKVRILKLTTSTLKTTVPTVKQCIQDITVNLQKSGIIDEKYSLALTRYACMIVEKTKKNMENRNPWFLAAAILLAADLKLARRLEGKEHQLTVKAGLASSTNVVREALKFRSKTPQVPPEYIPLIYQRGVKVLGWW